MEPSCSVAGAVGVTRSDSRVPIICSFRIAFDQFVEVHHGNQPPSPQKRLGLASADPTWPPYQATRMIFSIYDFAITLYDALVFDNPATSNAQLKLPQ